MFNREKIINILYVVNFSGYVDNGNHCIALYEQENKVF